MCSRIVIENGGNPALRVMTIRTRGLPGLRKLACVGVFVAVLTDLRRAFELHFFRTRRHLVTIAALHRTMRTEQWKLRFRMVEPADVRPRSRVVASLTAERRAIGATLRHAILEFAMMWVFVACGAGHILEDKRQDFVRTARSSHFMAIGTRHGGVRPGQHETGVAMFGNRKSGTMKILNCMATLTFVLIRLGQKLAVVGIFMAVQAGREFHLINRVFTCG